MDSQVPRDAATMAAGLREMVRTGEAPLTSSETSELALRHGEDVTPRLRHPV